MSLTDVEFEHFNEDWDYGDEWIEDFDEPNLDPYFHNYGEGFQFCTNTDSSSLEEHLEDCIVKGSTFYKGDYSNLVAFPDAYDIYGKLIPGWIAICRKV